MVPTVIERITGDGNQVVKVVGEDENPGAIKLRRGAFVQIRKHPKKPGHKVSRVAGYPDTTSVGTHFGVFSTRSKHIGEGYMARWVSKKEAVRLKRQKRPNSG